MNKLITTLLLITHWISSISTVDTFEELLMIRGLEDGQLHTRFTFEVTTEHATRPSQRGNVKLHESDLLPISMLELVDRFGIRELSVSLSRGRWELDRWYEPLDHAWQGYPRGAQVVAWLDPHSNSTELTHTLAGIFCSSLNRLPLLHSSPTSNLFIPPSLSSNLSSASFYHGLLPIEQPCTENLSPIFKLLPCHQHAGLSSLIDPHLLFDASWNSIRFHLVHQIHSIHQKPRLRLEIEIESVLDPVRKTGKRDWDLKSIFGHNVKTICPLSSSSKIEILELIHNYDNQTSTQDSFYHHSRAQIEPRAQPDGLPINGKHTYDLLKAVLPLDMEMKWPNEEKFQFPTKYNPSPVLIKRLLLGHGQSKGLIGVEIEMKETEIIKQDQEIIYFEEIPWWLNIYLHTCRVIVDGFEFNLDDVVIKKSIKPSIQRRRPYRFAFTIEFPTLTQKQVQETKLLKNKMKEKVKTRKMKILFEYEKDLLLYTEYPSDANRGFDLNSAGLILRKINRNRSLIDEERYQIENNFNQHFDVNANSLRFWSNAGLIDLATPDFSMPYNVIIVTSTAVALFFGTVFNLLVRQFKLIKLN